MSGLRLALADVILPGYEAGSSAQLSVDGIRPDPVGGAGCDMPLVAFPGLLNSHDHLDLACHPPLVGERFESDADWARALHRRHGALFAGLAKIPRPWRIARGMLRNLLCGVTEVLDHQPPAAVVDPAMPLRRIGGFDFIHSPTFDSRWWAKMLRPGGGRPVVVHLGEGLDGQSAARARRLLRFNPWRRPVVAVHGLALDARQIGGLRALVWCPTSNQALFGQTLSAAQTGAAPTLLFGTDSPLTGGKNIWRQLRHARRLGVVPESQLYQAITGKAAAFWGLGRESAWPTDTVVLAQRRRDGFLDAFFDTGPDNIMLIIRKGRIVVADHAFAARFLPGLDTYQATEVAVGDSRKWVLWPEAPDFAALDSRLEALGLEYDHYNICYRLAAGTTR